MVVVNVVVLTMSKSFRLHAIPTFILMFFVMVICITFNDHPQGLNESNYNSENYRIIYSTEFKQNIKCLIDKPFNSDNPIVFYIGKSGSSQIIQDSSKMYYFLQKESRLGWANVGYCSSSLESLTKFYDDGLHSEQLLYGKVYKLEKKENKL